MPPITYRIFADLGIVVATWTGRVSDDDLLPCYRDLYDDPDWKPGFHELVDLRPSDLGGVTAVGLTKLSELVVSYVADLSGTFKTAVIMPEDVPLELARVYEMVSLESPETVRVFRDPREATDWVEAPEGLIE